jgi:hypothetical protein
MLSTESKEYIDQVITAQLNKNLDWKNQKKRKTTGKRHTTDKKPTTSGKAKNVTEN